jgi:hypothetical protein
MRTTMSKMSKINKWADRYFVLHGPVLYYYLKNTDTVINMMDIHYRHKLCSFLITFIIIRNAISVNIIIGTERNN